MKDFNLKVTVRNAHILRLVSERYSSAYQMAQQTGMNYQALHNLISMKKKPYCKNGELSLPASRLCDALGVMPDKLWPGDLADVQVRKSSSEIEVSKAELVAIAGPEDRTIQTQMLEKWMGALRPREIRAIEMFQSDLTYKEIGVELGVSIERARQITVKAMRKMRQAARYDGVLALTDLGEVST